jgi:iron(III) transport system substrate-binding protein
LRLGGLAALALAAACKQPKVSASPTPVAVPTRPAMAVPTGAWDTLLAAARAEGTLRIATYPDPGYRKLLSDFEIAFDGIQAVPSTFESAAAFVTQLFAERQAGQYAWDLALMPAETMLTQARPSGALDPLPPLLIHPDVLDAAVWRDGFAAGFLDQAQQHSYGLTRTRSQSLWLNRDQVSAGEVQSYRDLLDPKWKGKLLAGDPRSKGSGIDMLTAFRLTVQDDSLIRALFKDQQVVLKTNAQELTDDTVRGRYPIGLGTVTRSYLRDAQDRGLGMRIVHLPRPEFDWVTSGTTALHAINGAPHPNVAALFANWALTRDGNASVASALGENSRRADVPPVDPDTLPEPGVPYVVLDAEAVYAEHARTPSIVRAQLS